MKIEPVAGLNTPEKALIEEFLMIDDKDGVDVRFILNEAQNELDSAIANAKALGMPIRFDVPKARQRGVSSYILARFLVKALTQRNRKVRIITHLNDATQKLLSRVKYYLKHKKGKKITFGYNTKNEITFPKTDSSFAIYTAGSDEAGRSEKITDLLCSEIAFWANPKKQSAGLLQTVPLTGEVYNESTGNGAGTWYHRHCVNSGKQRNRRQQLFFIPFHTASEYQFQIEEEERQEILENPLIKYDEVELRKDYPALTAERLAWRRWKIDEMDMDVEIFRQEYPMTIDECFMKSGHSFFHSIRTVNSVLWKQFDNNSWALTNHPIANYHYVLGADVAAGIKRDASAIEVICYETNEQVFEYNNNQIPPDDFAAIIEKVGRVYNWPLAVVESNNYGILTLDRLSENGIYPTWKIYWDNQENNNITYSGYKTTSKTKHLYIGRLRRMLMRGGIIIFSEPLQGELSVFDADILSAPDGEFDDLVIALSMANIGMEQIVYYIDERKPEDYAQDFVKSPFSFDSVFDSPKYEAQPLASQVSALPYGYDNFNW